MSDLIRADERIYSARKSSSSRVCCPVMWPWSAPCHLSVSSLLAFSFYQQLLLPARRSVTPQLSANKSSDLLPAFSHPLSQPGSRFCLRLASLCLSSRHLLPHTHSPSSSFSHHKLPSNISLFSLAPQLGQHMLQQEDILSTTWNSRQSTAAPDWTPAQPSRVYIWGSFIRPKWVWVAMVSTMRAAHLKLFEGQPKMFWHSLFLSFRCSDFLPFGLNCANKETVKIEVCRVFFIS